jgi:glycosyltransferase involved in cell wall biosynthesis
LLVAGEFYEDEKFYLDIISRHDLASQLILRTSFIPDRDVRYYLCAADAVVQPYRHATQSGVTPLAYHFEKPMIVTDVGGLPDMVPDRTAGIVTKPDPASIAGAIATYFEIGEAYFIPHLRVEKQKYSWSRLVETIKGLAAQGN